MHVCTDWYLSRLELHRLAESIGYLHRKVKIVIDGLRDPVERVGFWMKIHSRSSSNTIDVNMEELTPFPVPHHGATVQTQFPGDATIRPSSCF
jgi:hypothetical protein